MRNVVVRTVGGTMSVWCSQRIGLPTGTATHAAVQWWQLDGNAASSTVTQQGRVEDPTATQSNGGSHYVYPGLAVNANGDVLLGFSRFTSSTFASAAYAYRFAGDPPGTMRDVAVLKAGLGIY